MSCRYLLFIKQLANKTITISILLLILSPFIPSFSIADEKEAYEHTYEVMDKFHNLFDIYTDANAGGNHYIPSGWMGDWGDITFDGDYATDPHSGLTCIRMDYSAQGSQGENWAGIYWHDPENNWGNLEGGYNLTRATKLTFWARGEDGGEWIDFKVGGINRQPHQNPDFPYQDAFGPISTGFIQLTNTWQEYTIPLDKDYFGVYRDQHLSYYPLGWMGDRDDITFDDQYTDGPSNGRTCIRINYSAQGSQGHNWAGIYWQNPPNNWGDIEGGFDLTGFERLTFWARGEHGGERGEFKVGGIVGPYGDSLQPAESTGVITLTDSWQKYSVDLTGEDLSNIIGGFCWVTNTTQNPQGCTIYLDDIRYERAINPEDLRRVIGGFAWVTNKESNPSGCTFYLDDIQFDKSCPGCLRFLNSFKILDPIVEAPLANAAFTYDNALAMLAYIARCRDDDWRRAKIIGDTLLYVQDHDRFYNDGRLRNAYRSGDIAESVTGNALLPGWWNDVENEWFENGEHVSSSTGNMAWVIIAWLRYYEVKGAAEYLESSIRLGDWIYSNCYDDRGAGGYTGGYTGCEPEPDRIKWKSTEHNIDVYVAFTKLYQITGDSHWQDRAMHAKNFVEAMWNESSGHFWTGTLDDGRTINEEVIPLDAQCWGLMALNEVSMYGAGITWAEMNCKVDPCPQGCGFRGFDFNDDKDGVWFEGTAHMCIAYQIKNEIDKSDEFMAEIRRAQISANNNNGRGIVAACHDGVTTGFDWIYNNRLHVGATSWYIFAEMEYNPYWGTTTIPVPDIKANGSDGPVTIPQGDLLTVTVSLDPGNHDGEDADWWVVAGTPFGLFWYTLDLGWVRSDAPICVYGGPLFNLSPYDILNTTGLSIGTYTFYFGVDMVMNGSLDMNQIYYDSVDVNIEQR
jgi:hypothetical protein